MSKTSPKSASSVVRRIQTMTSCDDETTKKIDTMIFSLIKSRDCIIDKLKKRSRERKLLINECVVSGALRSAIRSHGPITKELIGSATKRVLGNIHVLNIEDNAPCATEDQQPSLTVIDDVTTMTKLTVTGSGDVRIKIGIGTDSEERERLIGVLTKAAEIVRTFNLQQTVRGRVDPVTNKVTLKCSSGVFSVVIDLSKVCV